MVLKSIEEKLLIQLIYMEKCIDIFLNAKWNGYDSRKQLTIIKFGKTKFGMERYIRGFLDLLSVSFVYRFRKDQCIFWFFGVIFFLLVFSVGWVLYEKISKIADNILLTLWPVTDQPLFYIALVSIIIGAQLFLLILIRISN